MPPEKRARSPPTSPAKRTGRTKKHIISSPGRRNLNTLKKKKARTLYVSSKGSKGSRGVRFAGFRLRWLSHRTRLLTPCGTKNKMQNLKDRRLLNRSNRLRNREEQHGLDTNNTNCVTYPFAIGTCRCNKLRWCLTAPVLPIGIVHACPIRTVPFERVPSTSARNDRSQGPCIPSSYRRDNV